MLWEHERNYSLGMDAPVTVYSNTNGSMEGMDALVTVCLSNTKRKYGLGMDALTIKFSLKTFGSSCRVSNYGGSTNLTKRG